ncbi:MAG TPA: DUF952 domain-containing protein [Anaerolineales bacterium]|nr:DUF952 domain-containing protein [Anaerolineales bacterium]
MIFHITPRTAWGKAQQRGDYRAESLVTEGFIHCSTISQVLPVAENFYKSQNGLVLLVIEPTLLSSDLIWEPPSGASPPSGVPEGDPFPHIYGPINLDAVVKVVDLKKNADNKFILPDL